MLRTIRRGGIFAENDGGDLLQDPECSKICSVRIPSGASRQLPLSPGGAFLGVDAHLRRQEPRKARLRLETSLRASYRPGRAERFAVILGEFVIFWADRDVGPYK